MVVTVDDQMTQHLATCQRLKCPLIRTSLVSLSLAGTA